MLRKAGNEVDVDPTNMKPVRVGGLDVPASKYGIMIQGADKIALTKLDVLSCYEKIPVCVKYEIDGVITDKFPRVDRLDEAKPIYEYLEGWNCDISGCRSYDELRIPDCGAQVEIGFNNRYLLDALRACPDEKFVLGLKSSLSPCTIRTVEGNRFTYLVLPVRLKAGN
jgi:hypothetical protein